MSRETCNFKKYEANCDEEDKDENQDKKKNLNIIYCLKIPGETYRISEFKVEPVKHTFPITDIGSNVFLKVLLESLPRVEEVPVVGCACLSSNPSTLKRRRSKDMLNAAMSEEMLANSLAAACSLAEDNGTCSRMNYQGLRKMDGLSDDCKSRIKGATFSPDLGLINPDMGCASGITRKLSAYSSPNSDVYCAPNSRGSTPEQSDLNDSGFSCSTGTTCEEPLHKACKRKSKVVDSSYQFYDESNIQVPSDSVVNYVLVDDRMQTPCRQKGKHRCNCDEESDQGIQLKDGKNMKQKSEEGKVDEKINVLDERRAKEIAKYMRRLRKEAKLKQRESGMSSQDNSECKEAKQEHTPKVKFSRRSASRHNDLISNKSANGEATTQFPSNGNDPSRQKNSVPEETSTKVVPETANSTKVPKQAANPKPSSDSHSATSIPILQASRFDHALRMGNYRTSVSLHGALSSREVYTIKDLECVCSSIGCDQMASVKSCSQFEDINPKTYHVGSQNKHCQISCCHPDEASGRLSDSNDNYQPSVKKLISSYTQTDDYACDCGKPLVPKCFDCSNNMYADETDDSGFIHEGGMRRSRGTHDLTTINKSDLFLEAIERCSRLPGRTAHEEVNAMDKCDKDNENSASSVEVAPNKCDSSNSVINKCQCDKNIFNINSGNNSSRSNDYNMISSALAYGDRFAKDISHSQSDLTGQTDITLNNNDKIDTPYKYSSLLQNSDKAVDFIRKPKHKRPSPFNKIEKIMMERIEQKQKDTPKSNPIKIANRADYLANEFGNEQEEDFLYKDEASGITYMTNSNTYLDHTSNTYKSFPRSDSVGNYSKNREQHVVMYEKGDYANFVHIESKQMGKHAYEDVESDCGHSCKHFRGDEDGIHFVGDAHQNWDVEGNEDLDAFGKSLESGAAVPSVSEMDRFRWRLDSAASMVFHSRTGLPLTSSPAPLRRGKSCFDFDSSINSVSGIKRLVKYSLK